MVGSDSFGISNLFDAINSHTGLRYSEQTAIKDYLMRDRCSKIRMLKLLISI